MRTKKGLVLFWTALFVLSMALQYAAAMAPQSALALTGAVFTSNSDGTGIDLNIYDSKASVYLTGGPCQGGSHLADGTYYFEVDSPNGDLLSSDAIGNRQFTVSGGFIVSTTGTHVTVDVACTSDPAVTLQLLPYADTSNPGGEYKLTVATASTVEDCKDFDSESTDFQICNQADQKSDNYKVGPNGDLKIVKAVDGGEISGDFTFHIDCGNDGTFDRTVTFPSPGFATVANLPTGAECAVTETGVPDPPTNFVWGDPTVSGSPATIGDGTTVTVTVTNHLVRQTGSLKITKVVDGGTASGDFTFHVDCGEDFSTDATITLPGSGDVTIGDIPAGAECAVTETGTPDAPAGFTWSGTDITGSPATIPADSTADVTVTNHLSEQQQNTPALGVTKSNDAPLVNDEPTAAEGDTVTYTLKYTVSDGPAADGLIIDTLPAGVTYVPGSATSDAQFTFVDFDVTTPGALTWKATSVATGGTLTYKVTIDTGAAALEQPLTNQACIGVDTEGAALFPMACDTSNVFVAPPPAGETSVPTTHPKTPPPTDVAGTTDSNVSGGSMLFILLGLVGLGLALVFIAPTPAAIRKRR